jgi:hypothetical protein
MALTRNIPLRDFVFKRSDVVDLLKMLSAHHRPSKDKPWLSAYSLEISENHTSTVSQDSPPKNFDALLTTPIERLVLSIRSGSRLRTAILDLRHGDNYHYSNLRLYGDDEDWVNLTHGQISKRLEGVARQNLIVRKYSVYLWAMLTLTIGWCLSRMLTYYLINYHGVKGVPMTWALLGRDIIFSCTLGSMPALLFIEFLRKSFPSIELRTGAEHTWKEARRQKYLAAFVAVAILGPSGDIIADIYREILK